MIPITFTNFNIIEGNNIVYHAIVHVLSVQNMGHNIVAFTRSMFIAQIKLNIVNIFQIIKTI